MKIVEFLGVALITGAVALVYAGIGYGMWSITVAAISEGAVWTCFALVADGVVAFIAGCTLARMADPS